MTRQRKSDRSGAAVLLMLACGVLLALLVLLFGCDERERSADHQLALMRLGAEYAKDYMATGELPPCTVHLYPENEGIVGVEWKPYRVDFGNGCPVAYYSADIDADRNLKLDRTKDMAVKRNVP